MAQPGLGPTLWWAEGGEEEEEEEEGEEGDIDMDGGEQ
jgi:DNA-directed RNA polymerase III subunit RPC8